MLRTVLFALQAALLAAAASAALAQFKWLDADGRVSYGDSPPRDARSVQRVGETVAPDTDPLRALPFELRRAAENFPVGLFTARDCAPCDAARSLLRGRGVPYTERIIASQEDAAQFKKLGFGEAVPVIQVGRQTMRAFEATELNLLLDNAGYPRTSQLPRTWQPAAPRALVEPARPADGADNAPGASPRAGAQLNAR